MRRSWPLCLSLLSMLVATSVAWGDRPPDPRVARCKQDPDDKLCREIRRACALRAVHDDQVPMCRALGWYGDSDYRKIVNLCPIEPGHADCQIMRAACDRGGPPIAEEQERICREMSWVANVEPPLPEDPTVPPDQPWTPDPRPPAVAGPQRPPGPGGAGAPAVAGAQPGGAAEPAMVAGDALIDFRLGLEAEGGARSYSGWMHASIYSFDGPPVATALEVDLGSTSEGGFLYRVEVLAGLGRWFGDRQALALLGGAGLNGIYDARLPFAVTLPLRAQATLRLWPTVSAIGWAQLEWYVLTEESRQGGSRIEIADGAQAGLMLSWTRRAPASQRGKFTGWTVGAQLRDADDAFTVSFLIGFGQATEPSNR